MIAPSVSRPSPTRALPTCATVVVLAKVLPVDLLPWIKAVQIHLDVGITPARADSGGVGRVVWIEAVFPLPFVGYAVAIGILVGVVFVDGVAAHLLDIGDDSARRL